MAKKVIIHILYCVLSVGIIISFASVVYATTSSNIDPVAKWAWSTNTGWLNFNPMYEGVTVYDDHLEGYMWGENIGWVRLGTYAGGGTHTFLNNSNHDYGINNDGAGNLSGYAWGTNVGWINFNYLNDQVTVDPATGEFDGFAWGENVGWIHFRNVSPAYNVVTTWRKGIGNYKIYLPTVFKS